MAIKRRSQDKEPIPLSEKEEIFITGVDSDALPSKPWECYDPNEKFIPKDLESGKQQKGAAINVKFSQYEYEMLKYVAKKENRSIHRQIKYVLMAGLENGTKEEE